LFEPDLLSVLAKIDRLIFVFVVPFDLSEPEFYFEWRQLSLFEGSLARTKASGFDLTESSVAVSYFANSYFGKVLERDLLLFLWLAVETSKEVALFANFSILSD
jgi:hypothetical protein